MIDGPAVFRHFKGGTYTRLFIAETHAHNGDLDGVYISHGYGAHACTPITRPFARDSRNENAWTDVVEWPDGILRQRFMLFAKGYDPFERNPALKELLYLEELRAGFSGHEAAFDERIAEAKTRAREWALKETSDVNDEG